MKNKIFIFCKMSGRPRKYKTDEERKAAKNKQSHESYLRNKEVYNKSNLIRYYKKKLEKENDEEVREKIMMKIKSLSDEMIRRIS